MDFGFIQIAAPASQPAPLADAAASADVSTDAADAFAAALAATLGTEGVPAERGAASGARVAQPAWLASLFAPTTTPALDVETVTAPATEGVIPADEQAVPADVAADDESSEELVALPADMVVPIPVVVADIKNPVLPQGGPVADGGLAVTGEPAQSKAAPVQPRVTTAGAAGATSSGRVPASAAAAPRTAAVSADVPVAAHTDAALAHVASGALAQVASGNTGVDPMPVDQPLTADAFAGIASDSRETQMPVKAVMPRPELANVAAQPAAEAAQNAATTAVANAIAAVVEQAAPQANATTPAARTEQAESTATPRLNVSWQAQSHQDAPMTGQDQHNQGRPSPEFTRFAAALAQVTSAGAEDGGRAAGPVAAPVAAAATPAPAATPATVATGAAVATTTTAETPEAENVGRLVQAMRVISRPGAWEANVRLKPEHLGEVSIAVRVERNTVTAVVNAEAAGVRQWLESQEQAVRSGMAEHGLHLDRFIVQRDGQRRDAEPQQQPESRRQSPRRQGTTTERFEIVV